MARASWDEMGDRGSGTQANPGVTQPTVDKAYEIVGYAESKGVDVDTVYAGPIKQSAWGSGEHGRGRAIDVMIDTIADGNVINAYLKKNAKRLDIKWVVFNRKIWSPDTNGGADRPYSGTPNPHLDHLHIFFDLGAYVPPSGTTPEVPVEKGLFGMTHSIYHRRTKDQVLV